MSTNIFLIPCIVTYLVMSTCTAYHKEPLLSNSLFSDVHVASELANRYPNDFDNSIYQQAMILFNRRPRSTKPTLKTGRHHHLLYLSFIIILQSADCELNPGPRTPKYPCLVCTKAVRWNHRAIACDNCEGWYHTDCIDMDTYTMHLQNQMLHGFAANVAFLTLVLHFLSLLMQVHLTPLNHYQTYHFHQ